MNGTEHIELAGNSFLLQVHLSVPRFCVTFLLPTHLNMLTLALSILTLSSPWFTGVGGGRLGDIPEPVCVCSLTRKILFLLNQATEGAREYDIYHITGKILSVLHPDESRTNMYYLPRRETSIFRQQDGLIFACLTKKTPWPQSASELYRPSDRRLSAKLVSTFCGYRLPRGQRDESIRPYSRLSRPEPLLFLPSSSSVVLTRLSGPCSRITTFHLVVPGNRTRDLRICSQELWPLDHRGGDV
jgi:hypothetical protein